MHIRVASPSGAPQEVVYNLPINCVFADLTLQLTDLNQDGRDEIIVIESGGLRGEGGRATGKFKELAAIMPLLAREQRISLIAGTPGIVCAVLSDNTWRCVTLKARLRMQSD